MSSRTPRDVVFGFSYETYADAVARGMMRPPDRILQSLMTSGEVDGLLVANPFRSFASRVKQHVSPGAAEFPSEARRRLVTPSRVRGSDPLAVPAVVRDYRSYDRQLRHAARELGLRHPAIVTTNPLVAAFSPFGWAATVTYFGRDDWLSSPARRRSWPAYVAAYRRISESEVAVAAVSEQIVERIAPRGPSVVVPNGIEPAEWAGPMPTIPAWLAAIPEPRAIYVGTIDERLDVEGLLALAAARPTVHIVLLGPTPDPAFLAPFAASPTIHVHAGVGRAEVIAAIRHSQVSLLAHRRTPLTEAMSPLKVYEYLAAGLPVVATDLPPVRALHEAVLLTDSAADMVEAVDAALSRGPMTPAERGRFLEENSWTRRHEAVLDLVLRSPLLRRDDALIQRT